MRRLPLTAWLALLTVGVVLVVVALLAPAAFALFGRLADENARARVQLAVLGAAERLDRELEHVAVDARLLAERPTLLRLTRDQRGPELASFLERFRSTSGLDGCAVRVGDQLVAAAPPELAWTEIAKDADRGPQVEGPFGADTVPLLVAQAPLAGQTKGQVVALVRLDDALARRLGEQVGLPVRVRVGSPSSEPVTELTGATYRSRIPIGESGSVWIEAELPASEVAKEVQPLRRAFVLVTLAASAVVVGMGIVAGRYLARPLRSLQAAAQKIGSGDLSTPIPATHGAEGAALAGTMEEMRRRLRSVTAELRRREAEARALLAGIVEGVFAVDTDRRIQYLNPQAATLLGIDAASAVGRFCGDVLRARDAAGRRPCDSSCPIIHARSRGGSRAVEHLQLAEGRRTVVITSAPPSGGTQVQVMRDETEIETARRSRDAVLANVSHELKTPLSAQLASIEILRDGLSTLEPEAIANLVASLERSTLRLTRLIDNLLESVRIETGKATFQRLPVEVRAVLDEAAALARPLLEQRRQTLVVTVPETLPPVLGDPGQLTQVFVNLLANANKYAPEGSSITVGGACEKEGILLWVEDSGPGIEPAVSSSIFDRFQRGEVSGEGMGLGLWIVKSIVERHGGGVGVGSSAQGGACFTISLPAGVDR